MEDLHCWLNLGQHLINNDENYVCYVNLISAYLVKFKIILDHQRC